MPTVSHSMLVEHFGEEWVSELYRLFKLCPDTLEGYFTLEDWESETITQIEPL